MNILDIAKEAGAVDDSIFEIVYGVPKPFKTKVTFTYERLTKFAELLLTQERERLAIKVDAMVDWPIDKHPSATILDSDEYLLGIRRGLVNATNAIRAKE